MMERGLFFLKCLLAISLQVELLHLGQCCDIPAYLRAESKLRWFYRYDAGGEKWLLRYKNDRFFQETEDTDGYIQYRCEDSFTHGKDFYMIRSNVITTSKKWCEKLHLSADGQALMRLRTYLSSDDTNIFARNCEGKMDDNKYEPQFLVKHMEDGFDFTQSSCGLTLGSYRAFYATSTGIYRCTENDTSLADVRDSSIHLSTCYGGQEGYPLKHSELRCMGKVDGEVLDSNVNGQVMLFSEEIRGPDNTPKDIFYCARYKVNETCRFVEMSINTDDDSRAGCAVDAKYNTAGGSSVALLLLDPDDPCNLYTEAIAEPPAPTEKTVTVIEKKGIIRRHVAMMYYGKGSKPSNKTAIGLINTIFASVEERFDKNIFIDWRFESGLEDYHALKFDIKANASTIDVKEAVLKTYWLLVPKYSGLEPINRTRSFKSWEGNVEICPDDSCDNNGSCVYNIQEDNWFCLCPEEHADEDNAYCRGSSSSSSKLSKGTLIIVLVLVSVLGALVVMAVILALILCRRRKEEEPLYNSPKDAYEEDSMYGASKGTITAFHSKSFVGESTVPDPVKPDLKPAEPADK